MWYELSEGMCVITNGNSRFYVQDHSDHRVFLCVRYEPNQPRWVVFMSDGDLSNIKHIGSYENEQQAKAVAWDRYCSILREESSVQS